MTLASTGDLGVHQTRLAVGKEPTRALATAAALSFASGYGLVMHSYMRRRESRIVVTLTRSAVSAIAAAALITGWQLLFVNDTVAAGVRVALWALVIVGLLGTVLAPLARRVAARHSVDPDHRCE